MVLRYFDHEETEGDLVDAMQSNPEVGTAPGSIALYLRKHQLRVQARSGSSLEHLAASVSRGRPVIVAYQAWAPPRTDYTTCLDHGHYGIVIAADSRRVTLCDPSSKRPRRHFAADEFLSRWRDIDSNHRIYKQWGCVVGPKRER